MMWFYDNIQQEIESDNTLSYKQAYYRGHLPEGAVKSQIITKDQPQNIYDPCILSLVLLLSCKLKLRKFGY